MATIAEKPIFCVVLSNGEHWAVEAEWPDGTIEHIDTFKAHFEALNWVNNQSEVWLQTQKPISGRLTRCDLAVILGGGAIPAHRINTMRPLAVGRS
jgi:hypothetical protein